MKTIGPQDEIDSKTIMLPKINDSGQVEMENDLGNAAFDVAVDVGPSSSSRRNATVQSLTGMMQVSDDPQTKQVLQAMAMMNMEGEGISEVREYFRKKLVQMGVLKPTDEEAQQMAGEAGKQDPNAVFLESAAEEAQAKAANARADVLLTLAKTEETKAKTAVMLREQAPQVPPTTPSEPMPNSDMTDVQREMAQLKLEEMKIDMAMKLKKAIKESEADNAIAEEEKQEREALRAMNDSSNIIKDAMVEMKEVVTGFKTALDTYAETSAEVTKETVKAIKRPKRVIRENGKIVGIE
jgi:hypothetical protein